MLDHLSVYSTFHGFQLDNLANEGFAIVDEATADDYLSRIILISLFSLIVGDATDKEYNYDWSLLWVDSTVENGGVIGLF